MRRLFVGDLHGCCQELELLLKDFAFVAGEDALFSVGDIMGRGPDALGCLQVLHELKAKVVRGNHEAFLLRGHSLPEASRDSGHRAYLASLGDSQAQAKWLDCIAQWPLWIETSDLFLVHAGFQPGLDHPSLMRPDLLYTIRTWDGVGKNLKRDGDPAWYDGQTWPKPIVFGHWAQRGLIDRDNFKGLDTGCVYGRKLTGWCPEEKRFLQIPAKRIYHVIK
jgi:hypothetical protein